MGMANLPSVAMNQIRAASGSPTGVTISGSWYKLKVVIEKLQLLLGNASAVRPGAVNTR
jgi:hypothetical protein